MSITTAVSDFFQGNPFSTPIGALIERSTSDHSESTDWLSIITICNAIHESPDGPKDALRAIRRRFVTSASTNHVIALHTLSLLDACVKNCGYRFHILLANRDVLQEFVKFVGPGVDSVPLQVQDKLLGLIQSWAHTYESEVDLREFCHAYQELRSKGIEFPGSTDTNSPLPSVKQSKAPNPVQPSPPPNRVASMPTGRCSLSAPNPPAKQLSITERAEKLRADLTQVRVNICVLSDLITDAETCAVQDEEARQLMMEVAASLSAMSERLIMAISRWETHQEAKSEPASGTDVDALFVDTINVNDELNTVLLRYQRVIHSNGQTEAKPAIVSPGASTVESNCHLPAPSQLNLPSTTPSDCSKLSVDELDEFLSQKGDTALNLTTPNQPNCDSDPWTLIHGTTATTSATTTNANTPLLSDNQSKQEPDVGNLLLQ